MCGCAWGGSVMSLSSCSSALPHSFKLNPFPFSGNCVQKRWMEFIPCTVMGQMTVPIGNSTPVDLNCTSRRLNEYKRSRCCILPSFSQSSNKFVDHHWRRWRSFATLHSRVACGSSLVLFFVMPFSARSFSSSLLSLSSSSSAPSPGSRFEDELHSFLPPRSLSSSPLAFYAFNIGEKKQDPGWKPEEEGAGNAKVQFFNVPRSTEENDYSFGSDLTSPFSERRRDYPAGERCGSGERQTHSDAYMNAVQARLYYYYYYRRHPPSQAVRFPFASPLGVVAHGAWTLESKQAWSTLFSSLFTNSTTIPHYATGAGNPLCCFKKLSPWVLGLMLIHYQQAYAYWYQWSWLSSKCQQTIFAQRETIFRLNAEAFRRMNEAIEAVVFLFLFIIGTVIVIPWFFFRSLAPRPLHSPLADESHENVSSLYASDLSSRNNTRYCPTSANCMRHDEGGDGVNALLSDLTCVSKEEHERCCRMSEASSASAASIKATT